MAQTFKARKMIPGKDTIAIIALHYGITPVKAREIIKEAGAAVIREDGFRGELVGVKNGHRGRPKLGWADGVVGVSTDTTKLTRQAILAVAQWAWQNAPENPGDN